MITYYVLIEKLLKNLEILHRGRCFYIVTMYSDYQYIKSLDRVQRNVQNSKMLGEIEKQNQRRSLGRWKISRLPMWF